MATEKYNLMAGGSTDNFKSVTVALTNAATTTAEIAMGPYVVGGIANTGAGDRTITLSAAPTNGGTSLALYDSDGVPVPTISLVNNTYHAIDIAAYVPYLIVTANAATATGITMHFKKQG